KMRVSEDPTFGDASLGDVAYRDFNVLVSDFVLADSEGEHTVYAQFKDTFNQESGVFHTSIVLDRLPPNVTSVTLNGGAAFLTTNDSSGTVALSYAGDDLLSGIDGYRYTTAASFGAEPFADIESVGPTLVQTLPISLGDVQGLQTVRLELRD